MFSKEHFININPLTDSACCRPGGRSDGKGRQRDQSVEERERLKEWMDKKRAEQSREYRRELEELRERERHPYRPGKTSPKRVGTRMSTLAAVSRCVMSCQKCDVFSIEI